MAPRAPSSPDPPEVLAYHEGFLTAEEEARLLALVVELDFREVTMRGQTARRTVRHVGLDYDYAAGDLVPTDPLPGGMAWLRDRCAALMERDPEDLVQILVSRYPPGAGIGWSGPGSPACPSARRAGCASSARSAASAARARSRSRRDRRTC
jgi:alkylated DNA repair dioxygenase AlkB